MQAADFSPIALLANSHGDLGKQDMIVAGDFGNERNLP
jgi:hypothetical protein